jgi:capsular exopolysaccharide synthesis family protein
MNNYQAMEPLAEKEVHLLDYWNVIWRRRWTVVTFALIVLLATALFTFTRRPVYTAKGTLLIEKEPTILTFEEIFQIETFRDDYYQTQYKLLQSRGLAERVVDRLKLYEHPEFVGDPARRKKAINKEDPVLKKQIVDSFLGRLKVNPIRMTRLVEVNFRSRDPKLAAAAVNELFDSFIDMNVETRYEATEQATQFLTEQIASLQAEIANKERQLQAYSQEKNIVALSEKETTIIDKLAEINKALTEAQIDRVRKEAYYNEVKNLSPDFIPEAFTNPLIQKLREEYVRLSREYQKKLETFKPEYPEMQRLKAELDSARKLLENETQNLIKAAYSEYQAALKKEKSLEEVFNRQKQEAFNLNSNAIIYNALKTEIENKKNLLESLIKRQSEMGVAARQRGLRTANVRVVDKADVPLRPSSPKKRQNLILALIIGLMGGIGLAFLYEYLDNTVKTAEDVERYGRAPALGIVPTFTVDGFRRGYGYGYYAYAYGYGRKEKRKKKGREAETEVMEGGEAEAALLAGEIQPGGDGRKLREIGEIRGKEAEAAGSRGEKTRRSEEGGLKAGGERGEEQSKRTAERRKDEEREKAKVEEKKEERAKQEAMAAGATGARAGEPGESEEEKKLSQIKTIELIPHLAPKSSFAESYRTIRTALLLSSPQEKLRSIVVSSPLPSEGKTATVANLAVTLAQANRKVLLIDADLRKPRLHRIFRVKNVHGLTNFLVSDVEYRDLIKATEVPNLYLINSGPVPPNPAELLGSEKMARLVDFARQYFHHILFDSPPVLVVADAMVLGPIVDGMVLVVWGEKTTRDALERAREKLDLMKIKLMGVVINNLDLRRHHYYYKHYYYDYYYRHYSP